MSRLAHAWRGTEAEQRLAALAAVALLVTMFFPWYGLQNLSRKSGAIYSHDINAFGDVSFVEAAIFLVALGVLVLVLARGEGREFRLPGGDGMIVLVAGGWATLLIFYRVFDRPAGNGYPVGIEWGFFLAFVAAGALAYAGWRMRAGERPPPPLTRARAARRRPPREAPPRSERPRNEPPDTDPTIVAARRTAPRASGGRAAPVAARERPRFPPAPEQLSFEDPPAHAE